MLKKLLLVDFIHRCDNKVFTNNLIQVLIETQPPYCHICKQYLTDFSCNSLRDVNCPYFVNNYNSHEKKNTNV